ncbi:MAG: hypothetical protein BGO43_00750 [Gammaproteobacteria bacterium 39-13]|nr:transposase [Gammaproteobacteria bacterium]OJV96785.1 MAG: hypothetical protein BGO43_00750 [Gammaproteobacteria bacterium 39-13]
MTIARTLKIDLRATPYYHCMTRCVRRTYLCGQDKETGQDFSHRKGWIVNRIKQLASIFAIKVCAYAVMSNHYHLVLFINEAEALAWNENEIKSRWAALFPHDADQFCKKHLTDEQVQTKIAIWQERLMCISWFMRCLNEPIARFSNLEDNCTGRFWEGRFKSQALLDEGAVFSAMAYVDLNPIRANAAVTLETSEFTSIYERIQAATKALKKAKTSTKKIIQQCDNAKQPRKLMSFANGKKADDLIPFKLSDYLQLVDTTGRILREDKRGVIPEKLFPILQRLNLSTKSWLNMIKNLEKDFSHAIGEEKLLIAFGARYSERAPKGAKISNKYYCKVA